MIPVKAPVVYGEISGNAQEPGPERDPSFLIPVDRLKGLKERLSGQILGSLSVAHHEGDISIGERGVAIIQFAESLTVSGSSPFDEDVLRRRRHARVRHR
jgi:hypothetical protein